MKAVYEVRTKHTDDMIKQYVRFQNNVNTPTKKFQSMLVAVCVLALILLVPNKTFQIGCVIIAAIILLRVVLDNWLMACYVKHEDNNYKRQNEITYAFGIDSFQMSNEAESEHLIFMYTDIQSLYCDEDWWYICMKSREMHIFAKKEIYGPDLKFGIFMQNQTGLALKNAHTTLKDKFIIMQERQEEVDKRKKKISKRGIL